MAGPALTPEQYVEQAGMACPGCGDTRFVDSYGEPHVSPTMAWCKTHCTECKATWTDEYSLAYYSNLKQPEVTDA